MSRGSSRQQSGNSRTTATMVPTSTNWDDRSTMTSRHSDTSEQSYRSYSTAPTDYSPRPQIPRFETCYPRLEGNGKAAAVVTSTPYYTPDARASVETYASTTVSEDYGDDEDDEDGRYDDFDPEFEVPTYFPDEYAPDAIPATPRDFAALFPTTDKLSITHDDSTLDGNMNLRLHTNVTLKNGRVRSVTLFHLRMYDLRNREFSLRRYSRDSGREVCHTVRKYQKPAVEKRSGLQRSFSSALAIVQNKTSPTKNRMRSGSISDKQNPNGANMHRSDSGYGSLHSAAGSVSYNKQPPLPPTPSSMSQPRRTSVQLPTNTIKLEFSNYAHVDIKRRGAGSNKRYEFAYWGAAYRWQRVAIQRGKIEEVSYHLLRGGTEHDDMPLAHIVPVPLTANEAFDEDDKGGWIPPCSLWMSRILDDDLADIVVASGLIALVDDSIKRRFHDKKKPARRRLQIPLPKSGALRMEYVGPRRLLADVFGGGRTQSTTGGSGSGNTNGNGTTASASAAAAAASAANNHSHYRDLDQNRRPRTADPHRQHSRPTPPRRDF